jgi:hypothetical protein
MSRNNEDREIPVLMMSPEMRRSITNIEFVTNLMQFSEYGALAQSFIIEAIRYYSEAVSKSTPTDDGKSFISPVLWHKIAVDIKEKLEAKYGNGDVSSGKRRESSDDPNSNTPG